MVCERLPMTSVCQSLAMSEAFRSSSYGVGFIFSQPFHQTYSIPRLRDLHLYAHNHTSTIFTTHQLCFSVVTATEESQNDVNSSNQCDDQTTVNAESNSSSTVVSQLDSLPSRYTHLKELCFQLCEGADVPSALDPWIQKLTLSDWNYLLKYCGNRDYLIAKKIMAVFKEKEATLDRDILFPGNFRRAVSQEPDVEYDTESSKVGEESKILEAGTIGEDQVSTRHQLQVRGEVVSPSLKLYTSLIHMLTRRGNFEEIDAIAKEVDEAGLRLNASYCNVLLDSYLDRKLLPKSLEIYSHMKTLGYERHAHVNLKLARLFKDEEEVGPEVLKEVAKDLKDRSQTASLSSCRFLLKAQWEAKDLAGVEEAFEAMMAAGYTPDMKDLRKVMQTNGRRGNHERTVELLKLMIKLGHKPYANVFDYLLHAYCKSGILEKARETFARYRSVLGIKPTPVAINMLIDGYGKQGLHSEALEIFEGIKNYGYRPTAVSYSSIISAMAQVGKFQMAAQLYQRMLREGVQPNLHTYLTLIRCYTKSNQTREGHKIYRALRASSYELTPTAYSVCLAMYIDGTWYHHAAALLREIEGKGIVLEALALNSLIRSFSLLQSKANQLVKAVDESEIGICKLLASLFHTGSEDHNLHADLENSVFLFLEEWKEVNNVEVKALVYNAFIDYFWSKGHKILAKRILDMGRNVYAGYSKPQLVEADWILDVRGLGVGAAKAALRDFIFSEEELLEDKGGDATRMVIITGNEFSLSLPQDNVKVKAAISSLLADLASPFVESPDSSESLEAVVGDILKWAAQLRINRPVNLF
ncbi:hypothetical protein KP509_12G037000 [Ceratopteris richardii]|uniref:Pentatricopeptide repeat-containing protein n=2 Tax=Ceratopteris richardii TaxID=49495 RepID=A0A8T2TNN9_CERRI|nr:hypothetical protein KP509_12G037000 [Ceratopteris richardii]